MNDNLKVGDRIDFKLNGKIKKGVIAVVNHYENGSVDYEIQCEDFFAKYITEDMVVFYFFR